jgi:tetratricopeptide (TPR) repeat protein
MQTSFNRLRPWMVGSWLSLLTAKLLSSRGLICLSCLATAYLATQAPWLRPPLSRDLRGWEIPLSETTSDERAHAVFEAKSVRYESPGALILLTLIPTAVMALRDPRCAGLLGGTLLCTAAASHAMAYAQNPRLVELLEHEHAQRCDIVVVLNRATVGEAIAQPGNSRVSGPIIPMEQRGRMGSAQRFLLYGVWLAPLSASLVLFGSAGSLGCRLSKLMAWIFVAVMLSVALCSTRLRAEYHWQQAWQLTQQADYANARVYLAEALNECPPLRDLQRSWYLAGKLDYFCQRDTAQQQFYRAWQLAQNGALAEAADLMAPQLARPEPPMPVRSLTADIWTRLGLTRYLEASGQVEPAMQATGPLVSAAAAAWEQALKVDPNRSDCLLFLALCHAQLGSEAEAVQIPVEQSLKQIADRTLRADLLATVGDVLFEAGRFELARTYYNASRQQFELPKNMNFRARRGLLGT